MDAALVSLLNQASAHLNEGAEPRRLGNRHPAIAPYETFGDLAVACGNDAMFARLCGVLGLDELPGDERFATNDARVAHRDALGELLDAGPDRRAAARDGRAAQRRGRAGRRRQRRARAPSRSPSALGLEPVWEDDGVRSVRSPLRGLVEGRTRPPQLGEHSDEIRRWLRAPGGSSSGA